MDVEILPTFVKNENPRTKNNLKWQSKQPCYSCLTGLFFIPRHGFANCLLFLSLPLPPLFSNFHTIRGGWAVKVSPFSPASPCPQTAHKDIFLNEDGPLPKRDSETS